MSEILPRLWLGNINDSQSDNFLKKNRINVIVNCTKDLSFNPHFTGYKYRIPVDDNLEVDQILAMIGFLAEILPIIHRHYKHGDNILIHCYAGIQRSAIVTLSYLYEYHLQNAKSAYNHIKRRRPIAFTPYMNFMDSFYSRYGFRARQQLTSPNPR